MKAVAVALFLLVAVGRGFGARQDGPLSSFVQRFESLNYDRSEIWNRHQEVLNSTRLNLNIDFTAFGRRFQLNLRPWRNGFSPTHKLKFGKGKPKDADVSHIYDGTVAGVEGSTAQVSFIEGLCEGHFRIPGEATYYLEPSDRYFDKPNFHSVIYSNKDIVDPEKGAFSRRGVIWKTSHERIPCRPGKDFVEFDVITHETHARVMANSLPQPRVQPLERSVCSLHMRVDPSLWRHYRMERHRGTRPLSTQQAKSEVLALLASHVHELNRIFRETALQTHDGSQDWSGVQFHVERTTIMTADSEGCKDADTGTFCRQHSSMRELGLAASELKEKEFCLAFLFTAQHTSSLLGHTWQCHGACARPLKVGTEPGMTKALSVNTNVQGLRYQDVVVPPRVSQLVFARLVGLNLGAVDDRGPVCLPSSAPGLTPEGGDYLMAPGGPLGNERNHDSFSVCSTDSMTRFLTELFAQKVGLVNCFKEPPTSGPPGYFLDLGFLLEDLSLGTLLTRVIIAVGVITVFVIAVEIQARNMHVQPAPHIQN